jgi:hypothetical protein
MSSAKQAIYDQLDNMETQDAVEDAFWMLSNGKAHDLPMPGMDIQFVAALILDEYVYRNFRVYRPHQAEACCRVLRVYWDVEAMEQESWEDWSEV